MCLGNMGLNAGVCFAVKKVGQFWLTHRVQEPDLIVNEFPEHVKEMLGPTQNVMGKEWCEARAALMMFLLGISLQVQHGRWFSLSVSELKYTSNLRHLCELVNHRFP